MLTLLKKLDIYFTQYDVCLLYFLLSFGIKL